MCMQFWQEEVKINYPKSEDKKQKFWIEQYNLYD